jgi:hypothetical protein
MPAPEVGGKGCEEEVAGEAVGTAISSEGRGTGMGSEGRGLSTTSSFALNQNGECGRTGTDCRVGVVGVSIFGALSKHCRLRVIGEGEGKNGMNFVRRTGLDPKADINVICRKDVLLGCFNMF